MIPKTVILLWVAEKMENGDFAKIKMDNIPL